MKTKESKVRTGGKVVSTINIPVYESLDEMMAAETEQHILACFNKANAIELQAAERNKFAPKKLTKEGAMAIAFDNDMELLKQFYGDNFTAAMSDFRQLCLDVCGNTSLAEEIKAIHAERTGQDEDDD